MSQSKNQRNNQRDPSDIMIQSKSSQDQIAQYLVKAVLLLRDRDNKSESVRLFGAGSAIPNAILVAEIIRARFKGLSSIATLENMQKMIDVKDDQAKNDQAKNDQAKDDQAKNDSTKKIQIAIPAIRIKLTCNPTQEELNQPGYQAPGEVKDEKKFELFPYVMIYAKNLFFSRDKQGRPQKYYNISNRHPTQQNENTKPSQGDRGALINRGDSHAQKRKPDQPEQKESYRGENRVIDRDQQRNQRNYRPGGRPKPIYNQSNLNFSSQNERDSKPQQGEVRTRGGNRK